MGKPSRQEQTGISAAADREPKDAANTLQVQGAAIGTQEVGMEDSEATGTSIKDYRTDLHPIIQTNGQKRPKSSSRSTCRAGPRKWTRGSETKS